MVIAAGFILARRGHEGCYRRGTVDVEKLKAEEWWAWSASGSSSEMLKAEEWAWRGGVSWELGCRGEGWEGGLFIVHLVIFGALIHLDTVCDLYH